ncbi:uncharacterized protein LOC122524517 [Polistes fuscatus]|uniref:uncharacterized protein LOC122524517 n=1 Tax=Polistes fuscatus TaxID=30207 RepID=UPI001CA7EEB0|nr:uncharacterized protein LOC122524517 [Polistes fuscatus]
MKEEDRLCESTFIETTRRLENGRYSVDLPLRNDTVKLGSSYNLSFNRFLALEKKLKINPELLEKYKALINDYKREKYIELIPVTEIQKTVEKHFYLSHYGILRESGQTKKLRIVFDASMRSDNGVSLNDLLLTGPNIQSDLRSLLIEFRFHRYVATVDIVRMYRQIQINPEFRDYQRFFWRDDPNDRIQIYRLTTVTDGISCSPFLALRVMDQLTSTNIADLSKKDRIEEKPIKSEESIIVKTLGLSWNCNQDYFTFVYHITGNGRATRRSMLSEYARIFDPMGYISPITVSLKILFQETWIRKLSWDDDLPPDMNQRWMSIRNTLSQLKKFKIDRCMGSAVSIALHGFLMRRKRRMLRTKLAPIKTISVARLELCAAHLLAKMINSVQSLFVNYQTEFYCWSDSKIVLAWLKAHPATWTTFVANSCSHILELIPKIRWHYEEYPVSELSVDSTVEEKRRSIVSKVVVGSRFFVEYTSKISSYYKLSRSWAYVLRFVNNCRLNANKNYGDLSVAEVDVAHSVAYNPEMGQLPEYRLSITKPFDISGIDFAGPITVRPYRGRGKIRVKSYVAVMVCMATKALHLELVFGLDACSLVMALKRFIAR